MIRLQSIHVSAWQNQQLVPSPLSSWNDRLGVKHLSSKMMSNQSNTRIQQLAEIISASVNRIQASLTEQNLPTPSFDEDAPSTLPLELSGAQDAVLDATAELRDLLTEPMTLIHSHGGVNSPTFESKPLGLDGESAS